MRIPHLVFGSLLAFCNVAVARAQQGAEYDYVIVGCGLTGLVVASRLSQNFNTSVLCLEAGDFDHGEEQILNPFYIGYQPPGFYIWPITSTPQTQLDGEPRFLPMGCGVGGGTLVNGMVWNRGSRHTFDSWEALGNDGWGWNSLLPYFRRSETFTPRTYRAQVWASPELDDSIHGYDGPVQVSYPDYLWQQSNLWFEALDSLGISKVEDPDAGLSAGTCFLAQSADSSNATRSDARRAYYDSIAMRKNLEVRTRAQVVKIIFGGATTLRATGIVYSDSTQDGLRSVINARRDVILAAGAIHTPQLLELSGIGNASMLTALGISALQDLPGVGNNLQDHTLLHLAYPFENATSTNVDSFAANTTFNVEAAQMYVETRTGPWTAKPSQAVAFLSLQQFASDQNAILQSAQQDGTLYLPVCYDDTLLAGYTQQRRLILAELASRNSPVYEHLNNNAGGMDVALVRPLSRGTCHINSSDGLAPPIVDPRWLTHPFDREVMIQAMQFNQDILDTPQIAPQMPSYDHIPRNATREQLSSLIDVGVGTEYHYSGTAAMLPQELGGVVDSDLLVYGTQNLRIVDTSIYPLIPGGHLQAVAYAVAEKASDIILTAYGHDHWFIT